MTCVWNYFVMPKQNTMHRGIMSQQQTIEQKIIFGFPSLPINISHDCPSKIYLTWQVLNQEKNKLRFAWKTPDQGQTFRVKIKYWCGVTLQTVRIEETTSKMNIEVYFNAISYQIQLWTKSKLNHFTSFSDTLKNGHDSKNRPLDQLNIYFFCYGQKYIFFAESH